jgi:hypothetical protein
MAFFGTLVGHGLQVEKDPDDRSICDYVIASDAVSCTKCGMRGG